MMRSVVVEVAAAHVHELVIRRSFKDLIFRGGDFVCDYFEKLHQMPAVFTLGN